MSIIFAQVINFKNMALQYFQFFMFLSLHVFQDNADIEFQRLQIITAITNRR